MRPPVLQRLREQLTTRPNGTAADPAPTQGDSLEHLLADAKKGGIDERQTLAALAQSLGVRFVESLGSCVPSPPFVSPIPIAFARQHAVMGFNSDADSLTL